MMVVDYKVGQHGIGYPSNCVAEHYAQHQPSIKLTKSHDNGTCCGVASMIAFDQFEEGTAGAFEGEIIEKNVDGTFLILVKKAEGVCFIYQKPISAIESPKDLTEEKAMYNKKGDVVRTYVLHYLDRVASSEENFEGTPVKGATITGISADGKFIVGTASKSAEG